MQECVHVSVYMYTYVYVHLHAYICMYMCVACIHILLCLYIVVYDNVYKLHLNHLLDFHSTIASSQIGIFMASMKLVTPVSPDSSNWE